MLHYTIAFRNLQLLFSFSILITDFYNIPTVCIISAKFESGGFLVNIFKVVLCAQLFFTGPINEY